MTFDKARLADCCIIKPPKSEAKKALSSDDRVSFVPMRNLGINRKSLLLEDDRKLSDVSGSYTYFAENDVLLAKITPCFENGKLGIATGLTNRIGLGSSEFIVFRSKGSVDPHYLYYYLSQPSFRESGQPVMTGAVGHKRVPKEFIENTEIPLPPIPEQKRIVAILDQVFSDIEQARAKTEQNLKNARELFESYLQQVFSQRGEGWVEKTLGEAVVVERGSSPRPIKNFRTNREDGVNWIKIGDAKKGDKYITSTKEKITREGATKSRFVDVGDFILSNSMSFGRPYIMNIQGYIHDGWFVLRLPKDIDSNYFYYLLSSPYVKNQFYNLAAGAIVKNISGDLVKKAILPFPSIESQRDIAKKLTMLVIEVEALESIYVKKSKKLNELKKSILQKAFTGELTKTESKGVAA